MWWKIFSAVLAAGLVVFAIFRIDAAIDRKAADWDSTADAIVGSLKASERAWDFNVPMARGPVEDYLSLRGSIVEAEKYLATAPNRAKATATLRTEIYMAKLRVSSEAKK